MAAENKIKILFVAEELATNGAMKSLLSLLKALPREKYDISLFLFDHGGKLMSEIPSDIHLLPELIEYKVHRLPSKQAIVVACKKLRFDLVLYRTLLSFQRRKRLDYHLWKWLPCVPGTYDVVCGYCDGFVAPMVLRKVNAKKKCSWIHFPYTHAPLYHYEYEALKRLDACVTVSHQVGKDLKEALGCNSAPQYVVHNIVDAEECIQKSKEPCKYPRKENVCRIVSVGRVTPAKGFEIIPEVALKLKEKGLTFEWFIVGDGEKIGEINENAKSLGVQDYVFLIGEESNPMPIVNSADVVVQPSTFESWGMTVSEALCLGKAVVTSDLPVFAEQIENGVNGVLSPLNPAKMAGAIEEMFSEHKLRTKLDQYKMDYPFAQIVVLREYNDMIETVLNQ